MFRTFMILLLGFGLSFSASELQAQRLFRRAFQPRRPAQNQPKQPVRQPTPLRNQPNGQLRKPTPKNASSAEKDSRPKLGPRETLVKEQVTTNLPPFWEVSQLESEENFRAVHVLDEDCVWACGSNSAVVRTVDGGVNWKIVKVPGAEGTNLRDIHAIDENVALVMSSRPARIFQTTDGGASWDVNFEHSDRRAVFNAFDFWNDSYGMVMGNPIDGKFVMLTTDDGGISWNPLKQELTPRAGQGEIAFAASGTSLNIVNGRVMVGLGGGNRPQSSSRLLMSADQGASWKAASVPISRTESSGIFSTAFATSKDGVALGGNYKDPESQRSNFAVTRDGGLSWSVPRKGIAPNGYRSCVVVWKKGRELIYVSVGPNGTDISTDLGNQWRLVSQDGFNGVGFTKDGEAGWAVGNNGKIARCISK